MILQYISLLGVLSTSDYFTVLFVQCTVMVSYGCYPSLKTIQVAPYLTTKCSLKFSIKESTFPLFKEISIIKSTLKHESSISRNLEEVFICWSSRVLFQMLGCKLLGYPNTTDAAKLTKKPFRIKIHKGFQRFKINEARKTKTHVCTKAKVFI